MTTASSLDLLIAGYRRFRAGPCQAQRRRYDALALRGQHPRVMVDDPAEELVAA